MPVFFVNSKSLKKDFLNFPYTLYKDDPHWVPPLRLERSEMMDVKKNPFFHHGEAVFFVAKNEGRVVGRISAQINFLHNQRYQEKTGHFGFFDCIQSTQVASELFDAASSWLISKGMTRMVGPMTLSINDEVGLLVEGYDSPPYPYMPHNWPYYESLLVQSGFTQIKDLIAWKYDAHKPVPIVAMQIAEAVKVHPGLKIREVNLNKMEEEIKIISEVFNSAWSNNWGFISWTSEELKKAARDMKMILDPEIALIAEVNGVPAAIAISIPNYHEVIRDLNGHLFPFGLFKLLYRLKTKKIKSARLCLLGIKKEFRHDVLNGLSVLLYTEMHQRGVKLAYHGGELSWTLEDNEKINHGISLMGGVPYKKYRVFEKHIA